MELENKPTYFQKSAGNYYEFYLSGAIVEASEYIEWFNVIRNTSENDTVKIYINSMGGHMDTALQFLRVLPEAGAHTIASVEGSCMSAATIVLMACDAYEITPHSLFMFHNYSAGTIGKGGEMYDQIKFERDWSRKLLHDVYKHFLTAEEIDQMLDNKDIWMSSEEVAQRLSKRQQIMEDEPESDPVES